VKLADYFTRIGDFDRAREVFEEALGKVQTSRDFGIVFNAYSKLEEELVNVLALQEDEGEEDMRHELTVRNRERETWAL